MGKGEQQSFRTDSSPLSANDPQVPDRPSLNPNALISNPVYEPEDEDGDGKQRLSSHQHLEPAAPPSYKAAPSKASAAPSASLHLSNRPTVYFFPLLLYWFA